MRLKNEQDAFGHAAWDHHHGQPGFEIIERSDGYFAVSSGSAQRARWLLRRFRRLTRVGSKILAETLDVYRTRDPDHLAYQAANRRRGRLSGQIRMRGHYKRCSTPWFDYLMVSRDEMLEIVASTGWRVTQFFESGGPLYAAVIERVD
jgi:hypothetical protein